MRIRNIILIFLVLILANANAATSMRRCLILPIEDSVEGAVAHKVFEEIEKYLSDCDWCYYQPNSEIMNILGNYRRSLKSHLKNKEVLRIVAEKTNAGSLFRIVIDNRVKGVEVRIEVIGANGEDIYFKEKTRLNTDDILVISQTVKNWMDVYEKSIPYDGRIIGILGNQFTVDMGKFSGVYTNTGIVVVRPKRKRRHPLLKEIVEWEAERIGKGKIFHTTKVQSQGKMSDYESKKRLRIDDWVRIDKSKTLVEERTINGEQNKRMEFGKLGKISLMFDVSSGSVSSVDAMSSKKIGGYLFGIDIGLEVWATRNYWVSLDINKKIGSFSKKEGEVTGTSNSVANGKYAFKIGYRYLPLGFFYGPRIDGYLGYAKHSYGLDTQVADGFVESSFKGLLMGTRGSVPLRKDIRAMMELGLLLKSKYSEEIAVYGADDSTSNYFLKLGGSYQYGPSMTIEGVLGMSSDKAKFKNPSRSVTFKETSFRLGSTFDF